MYIAYSALRTMQQKLSAEQTGKNCEYLLRYQAYLATCSKFQREIAAIQKYLPGWTPQPPAL